MFVFGGEPEENTGLKISTELRMLSESDMPTDPSSTHVATIDGIIGALYESVCFLPGRKPNYERLRSLFFQGGHLLPPRGTDESSVTLLDVEEFIARSSRYVDTTDFGKKGFQEKEIARHTESFGNIVHVFSTYESRYSSSDPSPIARGINSIQLVYDQNRWWVLSIAWDVERPDSPLPSRYLPTGDGSRK